MAPVMDKRRRRGVKDTISALRLLLAAALLSAMPAVAGAADSQETDLNCLAQTLYWEARTEGRNGMIAVGWEPVGETRLMNLA
jgi:hypothetical protein